MNYVITAGFMVYTDKGNVYELSNNLINTKINEL